MFIIFSKLHSVYWVAFLLYICMFQLKVLAQVAKDIEDKQQRHAWER